MSENDIDWANLPLLIFTDADWEQVRIGMIRDACRVGEAQGLMAPGSYNRECERQGKPGLKVPQ